MKTVSSHRPSVHCHKLCQLTALVLGIFVIVLANRAQTPAPTVSPLPATSPQSTASLPEFADGDHQLNAGATKSFRVHLTAGQFLHALIEQKDIDVLVTSYGPDGKQVGEADSPNDRWDSEPVLLVADTTGDYRIDIRSTNGKASAGRFEIKIKALRQATAIDRGHTAAQLAFEEGRKLRVQQTAAAKRSAACSSSAK
jgi:hypothetical protein